MPNMNGLEAAKELRARHGKGFKIYVLTANVLTENMEGLTDCVDGVLYKPCSKQDLRKCFEILEDS